MAEELDVGGIVATVRLDTEKADSAMERIIKALNRFAETLETAAGVVEKVQAKTDALTPVLSNVSSAAERAGAGFDSAAKSVDGLSKSADSAKSGMESMSGGVKNTAEATEQAASAAEQLSVSVSAVASSGKAVSGVSGSVSSLAKTYTTASDAVKKYDQKLADLNEKLRAQQDVVGDLYGELDQMQQIFIEMEKTAGRSVYDYNPLAEHSDYFEEQLKLIDKEEEKTQKLRNEIERTKAARENAAARAVAAAQKQAAAANTTAAAQSKVSAAAQQQTKAFSASGMALDTSATALRAVTSAAGGTMSQIGYLATELMYLKRSMQAATAAASVMASVISFGIMAAVTILAAAISAVTEAEEKRQQAFEEGVDNIRKYSSELQTLQKNMDIMSDSKSTTEQLASARNELASTFDDMILGYDEEGNAILANTEQMERYIDLLYEEIEINRRQVKQNPPNFSSLKEYNEYTQDTVKNYEEQLKLAEELRNAPIVDFDSMKEFIFSTDYEKSFENTEEDIKRAFEATVAYLETEYADAQQKQDNLFKNTAPIQEYSDYISAYVKDAIGGIDGIAESWEKLSKEQRIVGESMLKDIALACIEGERDWQTESAQIVEEFKEKLSDTSYVKSQYGEIVTQTQNAAAAAQTLATAYDEVNTSISNAMSGMNGLQSDLAAAYEEMKQNGGLAQSTVNSLIGSYPELIDYLNTETGQLELTEGVLQSIFDNQKALRMEELQAAKEKLKENEELIKSNLAVAQSRMAASGNFYEAKQYYEARKELEELETSYSRIDALMESISNTELDLTGNASSSGAGKATSEYSQALEKLNHQKRMGQLSTEQEIASLEELGKKYSLTADEQMDLEYRLYSAQKQHQQELEKARSEALNAQYTQMSNLKALGQLTSEEELARLEEIRQTYEMNADERIALEIKIYNLKQEMEKELEKTRADGLSEQYTQMSNLKALDKLTASEELAWLEKIRRTYELTAEERMALEIKIHNLKKQLKQDEIDAIDQLGEAITEALQAQYEAQRTAEQARISESIKSWDNWEKSTVESIQAEIDALEALEKEQDSQSAAAEYYQKSQELKLKIAYEKDDYQREQYEKELNRLGKEEQERQRKARLAAQKAELQSKMDDAKSTADARREALNAELEAINENYDELTSALSLRAQAEQTIMQKSQEDIVDLITSYAPEYNLAGETIGQSLYDGIKERVDNIYLYIADIMASVEQFQNEATAAAVQAAADFEAAYKMQQAAASTQSTTVINYTSNFNTPVQSPVQTKRAIESTASNLAAMIGG